MVSHPGFSFSTTGIIDKEWDRIIEGFSPVYEGGHIILSAGRVYETWHEFYIHGEEIWSYSLLDPEPVLLENGELFQVTAGGTFTANVFSGFVEAGSSINLVEVNDAYGNRLISVSMNYPVWHNVLPQLQVTDPQANTTVVDSLSYIIPNDSIPGIYQTAFSWDTGPYQGILEAYDTFVVGPTFPVFLPLISAPPAP